VGTPFLFEPFQNQNTSLCDQAMIGLISSLLKEIIRSLLMRSSLISDSWSCSNCESQWA